MTRMLLLILVCIACERESPPTKPPAQPPETAPSSETALDTSPPPVEEQDPNEVVENNDDDIRPVYPPTLEGEPEPNAKRLCHLLYALPQQRRATCCETPPSVNEKKLVTRCEAALSTALLDGAVTLDAPALDACEAAQNQALQGCDWVQPVLAAPPEACGRLLQGQRPRDAACRSTLECAPSLHCFGAGPTAVGRCIPRLAPGSPCGGGVDPLAAVTGQWAALEAQSTCGGYCRMRRCAPTAELGQPCAFREQCGPNRRCLAKTCVDGAKAPLGTACDPGSPCTAGAYCADGTCATLKAAGEACTTSFECVGACVQGVCAQRCTPF